LSPKNFVLEGEVTSANTFGHHLLLLSKIPFPHFHRTWPHTQTWTNC